MFDLNDVAVFVQVVRSGSFAEAGRRLGLPPNTVSRRVQQLEAQLGARLLQRSTRKLTLTGAGQTLHQRCAGAVQGLIDAGLELAASSKAPRGLVRVAAPADFFDFFPMEWVSDFLAAHPLVRLDFVLSDGKADLIAEQIDVAFRGGPLLDSGYVGRQLMSARGDGLVASPSYLAARGTPDTLQDLATHDCLTSVRHTGHAIWRLAGPDGQEQEVQVGGPFSVNSALALRKAAVAGLGIALLPPSVAKLDVEAGLLVPVLARYQRAGGGMSVLYPSRRHLPSAVAAFIAMVAEKLSATGAMPELRPAWHVRSTSTERRHRALQGAPS